MKLFIRILFILISLLFTPVVSAATYYIAPDTDLDGTAPNIVGSDTNPGTQSLPLKTFGRAWEIIKSKHTSDNTITEPVTIILLDGIYLQSINPYNLEGSVQNRLTIESDNDGKAIIDGEYSRRPIYLNHWSANDGFTFKGLVAKNSTNSVIQVSAGSHIRLQRVSAYNASNTKNQHVIALTNVSNTLLEDVVAGGTGRKMIMMYGTSDNITLRRVFALHGGWKGGDSSYVPGWWPQTDGIEFYGGRNSPVTNSTMENLINFGGNSSYGISLAPNPTTISNVQVLGSVGVYGGKDVNGNSLGYVDERCNPANPIYNGCYPEWPYTSTSSCVQCGKNTKELSIRTGFTFGNWQSTEQIFQNNVFQDLLAWGNLGSGLATGAPWNSASTNNILRNVTIKGNNNGTPSTYDPGEQVKSGSLKMSSVTEADIEGYPEHSGTGARLTHRYVDRQLTDQPLWPWPMEDRIKDEFSLELGINSFSVTCEVGTIINSQTKTPITNINVDDYCAGTAPPATPTPIGPTPTTTSIPTNTPTPTPKQGELNAVVVSASANDGNVPLNTVDKNLTTRWSAQGSGQWIQYDLGATKGIGSLNIAWYQGASRSSTFDVLGSTDGTNWSIVKSQVVSSGTTLALEEYDTPDTQLRYLRIQGYGNSVNDWNSITEVEIYEMKTSLIDGDTDGDGDVDIFDYNTVLSNFGQTVSGRDKGDLDGDDDVDIFDYNAVISNFGK